MISTTPQQKELVEQAASVVAADNMELACAFVQKTAIEKAIPEMDKRLLNEIELRKIARQEGRRYCDPLAKYQAERMPEQIRLKVGGVTIQQMAVYEEFARNIPGFLPLSEREAQTLFIPKPISVRIIYVLCLILIYLKDSRYRISSSLVRFFISLLYSTGGSSYHIYAQLCCDSRYSTTSSSLCS